MEMSQKQQQKTPVIKWNVTSDWHIEHKNVLKFCPSRFHFQDVEEMAHRFIQKYNKISDEEQVGVFCGDMSLGNKDVAREVISQLKCKTKILVRGNHDPGINACYDLGFDLVVESFTIFVNNQKLTFSHYPLLGIVREDTSNFKNAHLKEDWHNSTKLGYRALKDEGQFHCHGHIHSPNNGISTRILGRQIDVGVDANNHRPLTNGEIESWIAKTIKAEKQAAKLAGEQVEFL
jgi:calcineurin-like phosphoesterase family protein